MTTIDVICLTNTITPSHYEMTFRCLKSLHDSEKEFKFNVILVESNSNSSYNYSEVCNTYFKPNIKFNYNAYINKCYDLINSNWVVIINNDLRFERNWFSKIIEIHSIRPDIESFSPKCPLFFANYYSYHFLGSSDNYAENYTISEFLVGWCYVMTKRVFDLVSPWDEQFDLYYQDNDYAEILKQHNIRHALVRDSIATHLVSQTVNNEFNELSEKNLLDYQK